MDLDENEETCLDDARESSVDVAGQVELKIAPACNQSTWREGIRLEDEGTRKGERERGSG